MQPTWWDTAAHEKFAEALYLHGMKPPACDHYIFGQPAITERFVGISMAQWKAAIPFLEQQMEKGGSIEAHYAALRAKTAHVQVRREEADGLPRAKRTKSGRRNRGVWAGLS